MTEFKNCKLIASGVDPDVYHRQDAKRGDPNYAMSRSELMLFAANPRKWIDGFKPKDTDATDFGSLVDTILLDNARFDEKVAVQPATYHDEKSGEDKKWNGNATVCKEWKKDNESKLIASAQEMADAKEVIRRLLVDPLIPSVINPAKYQVLVIGEYHDNVTKLVIPVKTLIDIVPDAAGPYGKSLADYKTARTAVPRMWNKAIYDRHYDAQAAICLDLYTLATGEDRVEFRHIISENVSPFQPARRLVTTEFVEIGRNKIRTALNRYCWCLRENKWPSWDDEGEKNYKGWTFSEPDAWMITSSQEAAWMSNAAPEAPTEKADADNIP